MDGGGDKVKFDGKFDITGDGVIDDQDVSVMTKKEIKELIEYLGFTHDDLKLKKDLVERAKDALASTQIVGTSTSRTDAAGQTATVKASVGAKGDDPVVTKDRKQKAKELQLDIFRMSLGAAAKKKRRADKLDRQFQSLEVDRAADLMDVCLAAGKDYKTWDAWINDQVEKDAAVFAKTGKLPDIPKTDRGAEEKTEHEVVTKDPTKFTNTSKQAKYEKRKKIPAWNCPWCSYSNIAGTINCRACNRLSTALEVDEKEMEPGAWGCERCGQLNPPDQQIKCWSCGFMNPEPKAAFLNATLTASPIDLLGEAFGRFDISKESSMKKDELLKFLKLLDPSLGDAANMAKVSKIFSQLDSDDSGEISLEEFFIGVISLASDPSTKIGGVMKLLFDQMFLPEEQAKKAEKRDAARAALKEMEDSDSDSSDDSDDDDMNEGKALLGLIGKTFQDADKSGDGMLSLPEFTKAMQVLQIGEDLAKEAFTTLDKDNSGNLSISEFASALLLLCAKDVADGTPDGPLAKMMQKMFIKSLQQTNKERKARILSEQKAHKEAMVKKMGDGDFVPTKQTDAFMKQQRMRETKEYRKFLSTIPEGSKFVDGDFGKPNWASADSFLTEAGAATAIEVVEDKFRMNDVSQGELGDCYFLTSLSVMAGRPGIADKLVLTNKYTPKGMYKVRFCKDGIWQTVTVDDRFPVEGKHLVNAQPVARDRGSVIWASILEKAWAKYHGSYEIIEAGFISEALNDLTGAPTETFDTHEPDFEADLFWARMKNYTRSGFLMGCGSGHDDVDPDGFADLGLVEDHAYAFLQTADVPAELSEETRLVKIRNPWGEGEWNGAYADNDEAMTDDLKKFLKHTDVDDGSFWMCYTDFLAYFRTLTVCKIVPTWQYSAMKNHFAKGAIIPDHMYLINITKPTRVFLSMIQKDARGQPADYKYTDLGCFIVECDGRSPHNENEYDHVGAIWPTIQRTTTTEINLDDPTRSYLIIPYQFKAENETEFVVSMYCANSVSVKRIAPEANDVRMAAHCALEAQRHTPNMKIKTFQNKKGVTVPVEYMTLSVGHAIFVVINNMHEKWPFFFKMNYSKSKGLICERDNATATADIIPPNSRQILTVVVAADVLMGYSWGVGFQFGFKRKMSVFHKPEIDESDMYWPVSNASNDDFVPHEL